MSVRFDAANDRVSYTASNPPSTSGGVTVTAWAWISVDRNDFSTFARLYNTGTVATWATSIDGLGGPNLFTTSGQATNATGMAVGEWRRIAFSVAGTTAKSYVATATGSTEVDSGTVAVGQPTGITLGGRSAGDSSEWLNGRLAYVRVWSAELSQAEIEVEWASTTPVRTSGLWADWPLTVHTDLTDHSGNGRNLVAGVSALTTEADPPLSTTIAVAPQMVASTATVGQPTITPGPVAVAAQTIASAATIGEPTVTPGAVTVAPELLASTATIGEPALSPSPVAVAPERVESAATVGQPSVTPGAVAVAPELVASTATVGEPNLSSGIVVEPQMVASTATVGQPRVVLVEVVRPELVASTATVGEPALAAGPVTVEPALVASAAVVGRPFLSGGAQPPDSGSMRPAASRGPAMSGRSVAGPTMRGT